jgi:hypothetical protein
MRSSPLRQRQVCDPGNFFLPKLPIKPYLLLPNIIVPFTADTNSTELYGRTLSVVARSQYPAWNILIESAEVEVRYRLAGDWEAFERRCAERRGR